MLEMILVLMIDEHEDLELLYCDQFPLEKRLHNIPFLFGLHINHPANAGIVPELHRACQTNLRPGVLRLLKLTCRKLFHRDFYPQHHRERVARGAFAQVHIILNLPSCS